MAEDRRIARFHEGDLLFPASFLYRGREHPVPCPFTNKVTILDPGQGLLGMTPSRPSPKLLPDVMINPTEGFLRHLVSVIVRPSPDNGVEFGYHIFLLRRAQAFDDRSDVFSERFHVLRRRHDEQSATILSNIPPEEIKARIDMRDLGLFR